MFANATTQDNHPGFLRLEGQIIQGPDVSHDIDDETWISKRMKIDHVPKRPVRQGGTENGDIVLKRSRKKITFD